MGTWLYVILWILDIGQIIVAAVAYTLTETDYEPGLTLAFSELGHHIQRLEIAMVSSPNPKHVRCLALCGRLV